MSKPPQFLLDADSFIRSKREHYAFDFCPAYWDALLRAFQQGRLLSIQPVRTELLRGKDALADWVKNKPPHEFFASVEVEEVVEAYTRVIAWAEHHDQYLRAAKQRFAAGADPWLIAFALANRCVLVSYEVSQPTSKALIKLPDAARRFKVECVPPYVMLRRLKVRFVLDKAAAK